MKHILIIPIVVLTLSACLHERGNKELGGTLIGAALGGLAGSQLGAGTGQLVALGAGTLLGALLGSEIGKSLDKADRLHAAQTTHQTLEHTPNGQTRQWQSPVSGNAGSVTPLNTIITASGQPCREFQQTVTIGGEIEMAYGTACRQADGAWRIVGK